MGVSSPSVLALGVASLRKLALKSIQPPNACEQLLLARTYGVDNWVLPALSGLCERQQPIGLEEARQMSIEDIVLVATVREEVRLNGFRVKTARRLESQARLKLHELECPSM